MRTIPAAAAAILGLSVLGTPLPAADKKPGPIRAGDDFVELTAVAHVGREAAKSVLGIDPELNLVVVEVTLRPKGDAAISFTRDDFTLISRKDGQRTQAFHPSQIAGSSVLVVSSSGPGGGGAMLGQQRGPIWGGVPGTGDRPRRVGGEEDAIVGTSEATAQSSIANKADAENPVLAALKQKELVFKKSNEPTSGLLYFLLEGKHKLKQLEMLYRSEGDSVLTIDFEK
jgi:hypothetical protein